MQRKSFHKIWIQSIIAYEKAHPSGSLKQHSKRDSQDDRLDIHTDVRIDSTLIQSHQALSAPSGLSFLKGSKMEHQSNAIVPKEIEPVVVVILSSTSKTRETTLKRVKFSPPSSMTGTTQSNFPKVILGTPCQVNHTEQTHERSNSPPFILSSPTPSQPFNFQTQCNTLSSDDPFKSPINRPTLQFNNKRRQPPSHSEPHINSPKEAIQKARSLLILAASLEEDIEEQSKVLDLIEIFREYLEKGKLTKASNIITSQISHLENATKRIEKQANHLSNLPNHTIPPTINTPGTKANYATITKTSGEWNLVTKGKPTKQKTTEQKEEAPSKRLILIKSLIYQPHSFTSLNTRNKVNEAFKKAGINGPIISAITTTRSGNFILTTNSPFNAQFLMEKKEIWDKIC
ncbi:predicted protein [Sclerotinia sclerotiorum 1980 UF-70]|uniref:Uncharacterized protein n=2 Tax=Sclerotinia sclerotiorum (strain ATCC 18683 / 1980 / Ss-1) TaxID=665079 RepID=A7ELR6_SCLS1|nr:predicted protein [Sclerotinia sclerotiorum 1980 UF-70]EDO03782.1 predicted protein [Sclerotinia sclerotiorum 1980 UF-70]